ncbi:PaaI family thioesterase [Gracilimonas mengyeensis]|uniref:Acyl-CoA thioesterase n=1 Tax=Gracilimonas mengyeensis TaxID=1302730 RepID=A0A521E534_9BACT|nr:hotdog fold thioesterase [Gracilimonas mengyeensis]SMO78471.1 acyl-CoA thioesterase [Gracilimonas mengyeensis]
MSKESHPIIQNMLSNDPFSQWMGIEVKASEPGYCKLSMKVREEMTNGFGVCHGGITFSLADSALAFASNSRGSVSLALENNINYTKKVQVDDILFAETEELQNGRTIGVYKVRVTNQHEDLIAEFRGTVYRTGQKHDSEN